MKLWWIPRWRKSHRTAWQYQSISFALECYRRKLEWATARNQLVRRYGSMDASYSVVNLGLTILALLYGQGDFAQTLLYAVNGGYDTDCTAATALSILGIIIGAENIPEFWKNKIGSELVVGTVDIQCRYPTIDSLAKATCEAGLSFEKAGLLDVELVNVPSSFKPSLPEIESDGVEIQIEYSGAPVIGIGEQTQVLIKLKNITDSPLSGKMELKGPEYLSLSFTGMELNLLPDQEAAFPLSVQADSRLKQLPMENFFTVSFAGFSKIFGLMGAMRMKLFGPYWDNYDTTVYPEDPYHEKTQRFPNGDGDVHAMFNGFVNVEREYIPEDFSQWPEDFQWVNIHGSEFDIEEKIGYRGPACVYLVHDFYLDKDFSQGDFHFGCNAPAKIWINGKMVLHNTHHYAWTIFNCNAPAPLKKGHNQIIYKLTRTDAFHFSAFCRDWNDKARFIYSFVSSEE